MRLAAIGILHVTNTFSSVPPDDEAFGRAAEERAWSQPRDPGGPDDAVRHVRRHRDLCLRLRDPLGILVDGREVLDAGETAREVLVLQEHLCGGAVERLLTRRLVVGSARNHERLARVASEE